MMNSSKKTVVSLVTVSAVLTCFIFLAVLSFAPAVRADTPAVQAGDALEPPDLAIAAIKPYHYKWSEEYSMAMGEPYFNLPNHVNVTVRNNGATTTKDFNVALYADGELIGRESIVGLSADQTRELQFHWTPEGEDPLSWTDTAQGAKLAYKDTNKNYTLRAVVDEDEAVQELNETNNELSTMQKVVWNGFAADQPLEVYKHDIVNGGLLVTTGDAEYRSGDTGESGTVYGAPYSINYPVQIPGETKLARFYLYYTWAKPRSSVPKAPKIRLTLQNPRGSSAELSLEKSYNEIKGDFLNFRFHAWGTYAYDITNQVRENGTYVVTVENVNDGSDADFTTEYSFAAPAMLIVYEDQTAPKREYWITEGADVLMGGREKRWEGGFLGLEECKNSAEFTGEHLAQAVDKAVLGVVAPWADDADDDLIEFNGVELGRGLYNGYSNAWREDLPGLSMEVGANEAQQGFAAIEVTRYLEAGDNVVIQGDDGDNMMPATAVLVITYKAEEEGSSAGSSAKEAAPAGATPQPSGAAPAASVTRAVRMISRLEADKEVTMIFPDMDLSLLTLKADTNLSDATVRVARVKKPYALPEPPGTPYLYLTVQVEREQETASIAGRIEFKVTESWLLANKIDARSVTLNWYRPGEGWTALPTVKVSGDEGGTRYYEAVTPEFSIFAVTGLESVVTEPGSTPTPTIRPETPRTATPVPATTPQPDAPAEVPAAATTPGFEALAGAAGILVLSYRRRRRSRRVRTVIP